MHVLLALTCSKSAMETPKEFVQRKERHQTNANAIWQFILLSSAIIYYKIGSTNSQIVDGFHKLSFHTVITTCRYSTMVNLKLLIGKYYKHGTLQGCNKAQTFKNMLKDLMTSSKSLKSVLLSFLYD